MPESVHFTKMHGAGNDYIYVNTLQYNIPDPKKAAMLWSDRHRGIGSDGLVLIGPASANDADFSMRIFNADGSEAMMCGNASRCVGKYLYERGLTTQTRIRLSTLSGIKRLDLDVWQGKVRQVTVDMGMPVLEDESQFLPSQDPGLGTFVSMGNPHYVIFTDRLDQVVELGSRLESHAAFPERCNIEFAQIEQGQGIRTRVWERGSGMTMACGTGACATAVAAVLTSRAGRKSRILMDGGTLDIEWSGRDGHVYMTGPAAFTFDGEAPLPQ
ncbi:MAG: diaminopimelate epimerase [Bacteroidales bacterium]|nr:diaminopimelate epimerase [Bacteroidales bacterium]